MSDKTLTLGEQIDLQIRTTGPISVATYMGLCLTHPSKGYYRAGEPIGTSGDFITAPEISQMFGELIGFWLVNLWQQMGEPKSFTLLELGPGRGTLMADMLRVACRAPGFRDGLRLRLFETSPPLMAEQQARLETLAVRRRDLEDIEFEFKARRFDDPRSVLRDADLVGPRLDQVLTGAVAAESYWSMLQRAQSWSAGTSEWGGGVGLPRHGRDAVPADARPPGSRFSRPRQSVAAIGT